MRISSRKASRGEDLDGHLPLQPLVTGVVHDAHAAAPDLPFHRIGAAKRFG